MSNNPLIKRFTINILGPIVLAFTGVEVLGQLNFENPFSFGEYRFAYVTPDPFVNLDNGAWVYNASKRIKETIVYKKPFGGYIAETACEYETDAFGLIDNDSDRRQFDVLLLGNSFTAGSGGCPWTKELRQRLPQLTVYNAGLPGTGVENWAAVQRYLIDRGIHFSHALVIFISDDFFRPLANRSELDRACLQDIGRCVPLANYYYPQFPGIDLTKVSAARNPNSLWTELNYFWKRTLWISYFLVQEIGNRISAGRVAIREETMTALDRILAAGNAVHLVKVTTKSEAGLRADSDRSRVVGRYLAGRNLTYDRCELGYSEFFSYDAHPTREGYAHLAACLARIVEGFQPMRAPR
jgi:hypothetical protein